MRCVQITFPLSACPSLMSFGPENLNAFLDVVDQESLLSKQSLSPCSNNLHTVVSCWYCIECCLRGWRSQAFRVGFYPCPLCVEIFPDSLNLLIILLSVDGEIICMIITFLSLMNISCVFFLILCISAAPCCYLFPFRTWRVTSQVILIIPHLPQSYFAQLVCMCCHKSE